MYYAITQGAVTEKSLTTIIRLHEIHAENSETLLVNSLDSSRSMARIESSFSYQQKASLNTKNSKRKKTDHTDTDLSGCLRISTSQVAFKPDNIWDVQSIHSFLKALYL